MSRIDYNSLFKTVCMKHLKDNFDVQSKEYRLQEFWFNNFYPEEDLEHYHKISPVIINGIERMPDKDDIYSYIYISVLDSCFEALVFGATEFALNKYKSCITTLEEKYAKPEIARNISGALKYRIKQKKKTNE